MSSYIFNKVEHIGLLAQRAAVNSASAAIGLVVGVKVLQQLIKRGLRQASIGQRRESGLVEQFTKDPISPVTYSPLNTEVSKREMS